MTNVANTAALTTPRIAIAAILASKTNPRKTFDAKKLEELTASVKDHGVVQPVLVRPLKDGKYELVAGERRYRASKAAGLADIPATIRELTDEQCLQIQVIENLQRERSQGIRRRQGGREHCAAHRAHSRYQPAGRGLG